MPDNTLKIKVEGTASEGSLQEEVDINFGPDGKSLLPAVVQEASTGEVLLVAFMNREAFNLTVSTNKAHFWSRSRKKLWLKGETSGQFLIVRELFVNCEENSFLLKVSLAENAACHTGHKTCYYRKIIKE